MGYVKSEFWRPSNVVCDPGAEMLRMGESAKCIRLLEWEVDGS